MNADFSMIVYLSDKQLLQIIMAVRDEMNLGSESGQTYRYERPPVQELLLVISCNRTTTLSNWFVGYEDFSRSAVRVLVLPAIGWLPETQDKYRNFIQRLAQSLAPYSVEPSIPTTAQTLPPAQTVPPVQPPATPQRKRAGRKVNPAYVAAYQRIYIQGEDRSAVIDELLGKWVDSQRAQGFEPDASLIDAERKKFASGIDYQVEQHRQ